VTAVGWPEDWTPERVREAGQLRDVPRLLNPTTAVTIETVTGIRRVDCSVLIDCGGLVLAFDPVHADWMMGQQADDGTVRCWASYGTDLDAALKSL
jgi:hypothetical protein